MAATSDTLFFAVSLLLHDLPFVQEHGARFDRTLFPKGPLQALAALALDQAQRYRRTTSPTVLDVVLQNGFRPDFYGTTDEEMRRVFRDLEHFLPDFESRGRIIQTVLEWLELRRLGMAGDALMAALDKGDTEDAVAVIRGARPPYSPVEQPLRLNTDLTQVLGALPENAVPTGFKEIDQSWRGGIRPGEFGVILASTNAGKTMALCHLAAIAYKADKHVLFYTFELAPAQVLRRIISAVLRRPVQKIAEAEVPMLFEQMRRNRQITKADIEIRAGTKSVADLLLDLDELTDEGRRPDLVLLDSADDLIAVGKYQSDYQRLGEIYWDIRRLALAAEVPVWTSTQATREAIDKAKISLKHMGDSFWKARRAHYVLGLSQTEQERNEPFGPHMNLSILKDSEHGTPGRSFQLRPMFGRGDEGFPGFEEVVKVGT